jgi:hypothetical protein
MRDSDYIWKIRHTGTHIGTTPAIHVPRYLRVCGEAEVRDESMPAVVVHQYVLGLEVAVVDAAGMTESDGVDEARKCALDEGCISVIKTIQNRSVQVTADAEVENQKYIFPVDEMSMKGDDVGVA